MASPTFKLNTGATIPAIGLGTWQSKPEEVTAAVEHALKTGYRHIDCAWMYGNEAAVGEGIRRAGIPRSELFVTSKLWSTHHTRVAQSLQETLQNLGLDYLDLYLIHWPVPLNPNGNHPTIPTLPSGKRDVLEDWDIRDTWKQMEAVYREGKAKAIGVSNFSKLKLEHILATAEVVPAVDQLELHLYNPDPTLLAYLKEKGILPQAYSPLGSTGSPLLSDEVVVELAKKHSADPSAIALAYLLAKGIVALPKSVTPARITQNLEGPIKVKLDEEDVKKLDALAPGGKQRRFIAPPWPIELGFDNWPPLK
ncbi:Aldo/keto reductase [Exidia glandulosa HHB12029]|uniref:Aldo/keto reductase n=1 Tax=Exidia glandulosa HHB12029 TaxID=1314781 RepID=A0A165E2H4_EXIGL|nr:Aldo/keto reductase [Exidia glandulosa HHB12029]